MDPENEKSTADVLGNNEQGPLSPSKATSITALDDLAEPKEQDVSSSAGAVQVEAPKYSVFTKNEKWFLVFLGTPSLIFYIDDDSPLTANIYLPAIPVLAVDFNKSLELINLTITTYMIFQAIAPMFWAPFADRYGRRIVFILCMGTLCASCIGLALVPTNAYWLLLFLRCFQAAGSASTVALSAGLIIDIALPSERGTFLGIYSIGPMVGPCIGPIIGGGLSGSLGWRSIFWFLCIFAGGVLVIIVLMLPETLRSLVGDGSIPPPRISRPIIPFGKHPISPHVKLPPRKSLENPLKLFLNPDVLLILIFNSVLYAVFYGVTTTISLLFPKDYPFLTQTDIGLCFIAVGAGAIPGSWMTGRLLDRDFKIFEKKYKEKMAKMAPEASEEGSNLNHEARLDVEFPLERARLRMTPINLGIFVACVIGYGWSLEANVHIAVPLVLTFIIGLSGIGIFNSHQNLIMDLFPGHGSSITAANNLFRCAAGAALVAVEELILDALHPGWTFVLFGGICVLFYPLSYCEMRYGPRFRAARQRKAESVGKSH
ncbi:MFS general substrate transporter [Sistotremastrum niveocremeum HHB9708]|uniref:MFS general substrate transporter n=2 Tax=Sistotremastraceae TaxID=3402574 RepID=A0A164TPL9_9AGAM|nr:MFS general substrate transporter [Sistotremastrum niveocremeum HHB9708]KZT42206.1 MFS general substrate transporter [Sistotremastrum suecicum HHB10207 ss-3]